MSALGDLTRTLAYAHHAGDTELWRRMTLIWFDTLSAIDKLGYIGQHGGPPEGWTEYQAAKVLPEVPECLDPTTSEMERSASDGASGPTGRSTKPT